MCKVSYYFWFARELFSTLYLDSNTSEFFAPDHGTTKLDLNTANSLHPVFQK